MWIALTQSHHAKWCGSGYPDRLVDEDIPLYGRIMALVDVYDASRSKRPYREAFTHEESFKIIEEDGGCGHFDPAIIEAFLAVKSEFADIRRRMDDGAA